MLTIIISIVLAFVLILILSNTKMKSYDLTILVGAVLIIGVIIATSPIYGYEDDVYIGETKLVPIEDTSEQYAICYNNGVYMYRYDNTDITKSLDKTYETNIIKGNIIENKSANCEQPALKMYKRKAKKGLFSFCWEKELVYEFYVPEDGIKYVNESLN